MNRLILVDSIRKSLIPLGIINNQSGVIFTSWTLQKWLPFTLSLKLHTIYRCINEGHLKMRCVTCLSQIIIKTSEFLVMSHPPEDKVVSHTCVSLCSSLSWLAVFCKSSSLNMLPSLLCLHSFLTPPPSHDLSLFPELWVFPFLQDRCLWPHSTSLAESQCLPHTLGTHLTGPSQSCDYSCQSMKIRDGTRWCQTDQWQLMSGPPASLALWGVRATV